ncbi:MAG TPA: hypothetical protein VG497_17490 [Kribbella sp.]|nr:hypothetical protein [Kribbella sp.]
MTDSRRGRVPRGIYSAGEQVFRFAPDGVVLDVLVKPAPTAGQGPQLASWLRPGLSGVHETTYVRTGRRISFSTVDHFTGAPVAVTGSCHGDELVLDLGGRRDVRFRRIWV